MHRTRWETTLVLPTSMSRLTGNEASPARIRRAVNDWILHLPDDVLLRNIRAAESVLGAPHSCPNADLASLEAKWRAMLTEAIGRALPGVLEP